MKEKAVVKKAAGPGKGGARAGAGRPPTKKDAAKYTLYLSAPAVALADALAAKLGVSRSEAIEIAVRGEAKRRKIEVG